MRFCTRNIQKYGLFTVLHYSFVCLARCGAAVAAGIIIDTVALVQLTYLIATSIGCRSSHGDDDDSNAAPIVIAVVAVIVAVL